MPFFSLKKHHPRPVCTWSTHAPQSGPSPLPFPRSSHTLTATATAGELLLFGGFTGPVNRERFGSSDLYVFSTRDFSTTLLQTSGDVPSPRGTHGAALISTNTLLIYGGNVNPGDQNVLNHDSLHLLNLVSREWTRVVVNGPGPGGRGNHTTIMVGSKLFVFGGQIGGKTVNDMWTLNLNSLKSQPHWESYEPTPRNENPLPRYGHVSVTTGDRIVIFGGSDHQRSSYYNDTWSFDISTRKWTELQCTGFIPSARRKHAAVLVDDVMYVFGGYTGKTYSDDMYALQLSTQRWFKLRNVGLSPDGRSAHAMASDGTLVFVLGGRSNDARSDELSLIHVFDTKDIKYPEPERNAVNPNGKTTQLARKSSTGHPTQEQPQHPKSSSSEDHVASRLQNATPSVSGVPATLQIAHERNPGPNGQPLELTDVNSRPRQVPEDDVKGSTKAPIPSSSEVTRLELEQQLSQTEWDQRITRLTTLLEQAEANATVAAGRAELEPCKHADRLLMQASLVEQRDAELVDMQAKLDQLVVSRDQQVRQYEKELTIVHAKLEAKEAELEAVRLRLTEAEKGWTKSKAEADTLRAQTASGSVHKDEDQVTGRLLERMRAIEAEVASKRWNEKRIEEMECRNED